MPKSKLHVSIVIPVYNEHDHLAACLDAIARQKIRPYEIIVVDNNSTDDSAAIAKNFPFVKLLREPRQGVVHARDLGFDAAKGEIIGRIDADTLLPAEWVEKVQVIFGNPSIQAVSGRFHFYDIGWSSVVDGIDTYWRAWMAKRMAMSSRIFLNGSNMALRRSAWHAVRDHVCRSGKIHEDLDLALHLSTLERQVVYEPQLVAGMSARRVDSGPLEMVEYAFMSPVTYMRHKAREHIYMYPLIAIALLTYPLLRLMFRAFDVQTQQLSLRTMLGSGARRVNPAASV